MMNIAQKFLAALCCVAGLAASAAAETTGTADAATTAPATAGGKKIILLGESPRWEVDAGRVATQPVAPIAQEVFGQAVEDRTTTGELIADTIKKSDGVAESEPALVVVFTGKADETAGIDEDTHMKAISDLGRKLRLSGAPVFIVPSDPSLAAGTVASLRIASNLAEIEFVEPGTEIGGSPYRVAFNDIRKAQSAPKTTATAPPGVATLDTIAPPPGERSVRVDPTQTSAVIRMKPPAALKQFDPVSQAGSKPPRIKKKPATAK